MNFSRIDWLQAQISQKRPLNQTEIKRIRSQFMIENTYNSNAIEGNTLTLRETALILQEGITIGEKPLRDHLEVIGHRDAFEYMISLVDAKERLTEKAIKEIHSLVLMNDASNRGIYRGVPVTILGAVHTPPQPYLVPIQMEQLLRDYEESVKNKHMMEAVGTFHLRFEGIHPFIDGNGRTGRLLLNFALIKAGLLPVNIKYADRRKYYECFDHYFGEERSSKPLIELLVNYEIEELERYLSILER